MKYQLRYSDITKAPAKVIEKYGFVRGDDGVPLEYYEDGYKPVFIEINTFEELQDFINTHGTVIIFKDLALLEVYNSYRE